MQPDNGDPWWVDLIINVVVTAGILGWGLYIGSRRELIWTLEQRAERAEAEQELRVSQARGNERARIAREMHDVLAHRISQISMHAGALGFRSDLDADELRANATVIRDLANDALTDLRGVLGVLRDPETGELASAPQPTWADLPALVEQAREAGLHVEVSDRLPDGEPRARRRRPHALPHRPGGHHQRRQARPRRGAPHRGQRLARRRRRHRAAQPARLRAQPHAGLGARADRSHRACRAARRPARARRDGQQFVLRGWIPWAA